MPACPAGSELAICKQAPVLRNYLSWHVSLNLILEGDLSRKTMPTAHNLITLFGIDGLLIEFDKCIIFFHVTNLSVMLCLIKNVVAYFFNITF